MSCAWSIENVLMIQLSCLTLPIIALVEGQKRCHATDELVSQRK